MPLTDKDREDARDVLKRGWLTIEQVTSTREAVGRTGMNFREAALAKGFLNPSQAEQLEKSASPGIVVRSGKPSTFYPVLLMTTLSMIIAGGIYLYAWYEARQAQHERETRNERREGDRKAQTSAYRLTIEFQRGREERRLHLVERARKAFAGAGTLRKKNPEAFEIEIRKTIGWYNQAIHISPDAGILDERARAHELWGAWPEAIADLERSAKLNPDAADEYGKRITALKLRLPAGDRKP